MEIYGDSLQFQRIDFFFDYNRRHLSLPGNNISRNNATLVDNKSRFFFSLETIWKESIYRGRISSSWTSFAFIRFFYHLYKPFRLEFRKANGLDPVSIRNSGGLRGFKTWMGGEGEEKVEGFERALTPERRHLSLGR